MRTRQMVCACSWFLSFALWGSAALAQDAATAGALFDKGVSDMQAGRFDTGCPALEESQQLDPHPGTLFTLAECQAKWGKVASAVTHYQDYLGVVSRLLASQRARHRDRESTASAQLAKLKPLVPTLTLVLPANAPPGTTVTRNGVVLQAAALKLALPVDPGEYQIVTRAPEGEDYSITVSIALRENKSVALQVRAKSSPPKRGLAEPSAHSDSAAEESHPAPTTDSAGSSKGAAYVAGGIGIAGIVVGSVTGIMVLSKKTSVNSDCPDHACNSSDKLDAANGAKRLALVSNVGFAVGIAGLATGAVLLLSGHRAQQTGLATVRRWEPLLAGTPGGAWAGLVRRW